jgi:PAS domain S-box-containing protein
MSPEAGWEELFEAAFLGSRTAMELLDGDRRRVSVNDPFCALAGRPREELVGTRLEDLIAPEYVQGVEAAWKEFLESREWLGSWAIVRPDGSRVYAEIAGVLADVGARRRALFVYLDVEPMDPESPTADRSGPLSAREAEVVNLIARGNTNPQIAELLVVAPSTVRTHVRNAMGKVGAHTRAHLVALVMIDSALLH